MPSQAPHSTLFVFTALLIVNQAFATPTPQATSTPSLSVTAFGPSTCTDIHTCRTTWEIVWGCATTIFLCTWVAYHPDVVEPSFTKRRIFAIRIICVVLAFLFPELVVEKAAGQWWETREYEPAFEGWTRTHSYFTIMGGFSGLEKVPGAYEKSHLDLIKKLTAEDRPQLLGPAHSTDLIPLPDTLDKEASLPDSLRPRSPLNESRPPKRSFWNRLRHKTSSEPTSPKYRILVTRDEIRDRSKSNSVAKLIAVTQTSWFILQFLERWRSHQKRTQIEIMTLAYAVLNIMVYGLWWRKPYNVDEPIHVRGRADNSLPDRTVGLTWELYDILQDGFTSMWRDHGIKASPLRIVMVIPLVGVVFGGLHCLAWSFHFPTQGEALLWRLGAVYCTAAPMALFALFYLRSLANISERILRVCDAFIYAGIAGYALFRIILLGVTISCLRASPPGVFMATAWTRLLPHIG